MNFPSFIELIEEETEDDVAKREAKYLLDLLPHVEAKTFIPTHKPNVHAIVNTTLQVLEIYLPTGGVLYCSLIDVDGDMNPWKE